MNSSDHHRRGVAVAPWVPIRVITAVDARDRERLHPVPHPVGQEALEVQARAEGVVVVAGATVQGDQDG